MSTGKGRVKPCAIRVSVGGVWDTLTTTTKDGPGVATNEHPGPRHANFEEERD